MQKYALSLSYIGTNYAGWQTQKDQATVEEKLVHALSKVANHPIKLICAGRTDAGVHALMQVVHFSSDADRSIDNWVRGGNSYLPNDIEILWVRTVQEEFNSRFSASSRKYVYIVDNNEQPCLLMQDRSLSVRFNLDVREMIDAAKFLLGEHDFSAFRASGCQSSSAMRHVDYIDIEKRNGLIFIVIKANAFLYHMVRNIVGVLLLVGLKKKPANWVRFVLESKDRCLADKTVFSGGLYLYQVEYPEKYNLPLYGKKFFSIGDLYVC